MVQNKDLHGASRTFLYNRVDCKTVGFFHKISKEIGKAWREAREPHMPVGRVRREKKKRLSVSPQSHSPFSASFQTFLFDCLRLLEYAKIRTVLKSNNRGKITSATQAKLKKIAEIFTKFASVDNIVVDLHYSPDHTSPYPIMLMTKFIFVHHAGTCASLKRY